MLPLQQQTTNRVTVLTVLNAIMSVKQQFFINVRDKFVRQTIIQVKDKGPLNAVLSPRVGYYFCGKG